MPVSLYTDVHVPRGVVEQLRRRGVDVLTAVEDGQGTSDDAGLIRRALALGRVIFTHDIRFKALAEQMQRDGELFSGLIFAHPLHVTIGQVVRDLELIALTSGTEDWGSVVEHLPF
jgi:hypothetical protein